MNKKHIYFTSEAVSEGHPDKVADQISDAVLDAYLAKDPESKVACETLVTTGQVLGAGEVRSSASVDVPEVARKTIKRIGYDKPEYMFDGTCCGIINLLHEQSADINRGVVRTDEEKQGAGDQGMMFGYATNETENYMPLPLYLANLILLELKAVRKEGKTESVEIYSEKGNTCRVQTDILPDELVVTSKGKQVNYKLLPSQEMGENGSLVEFSTTPGSITVIARKR